MLFVLSLALAGTPGALAPCPPTPNCVRSFDEDAVHAIAALPIHGDPATLLSRLETLLLTEPRVTIAATTDAWIHATATTALWRFVDDLELLVDTHAGVVHVRSASRVGGSDLGVNRARVERLRARWAEAAR